MYRLYAHQRSLAAAANALMLAKCLRLHMWDTSCLQTRQLPCINRPLAERLKADGIASLAKLNEADPRHIETAAKRPFPFGGLLLKPPHVLRRHAQTFSSKALKCARASRNQSLKHRVYQGRCVLQP